MTGRHVGPPAGSAARDATASPYAGKRRARLRPGCCFGCGSSEHVWATCFLNPVASAWEAQDCPDDAPDGRCWDCRADKREPHRPWCRHAEPDDLSRCWSCGHWFGDGCECACCNDDHQGGPDDV